MIDHTVAGNRAVSFPRDAGKISFRSRIVRGTRRTGLGFALAALAVPPALLVPPASPTPVGSGVSAGAGSGAAMRTVGPMAVGEGGIDPAEVLLAATSAEEPEEPQRGLADAAVAAGRAVADRLPGLDLRIAVLDRAVDETAATGPAAEPFYTASLSKLLLAVDVVDRRRDEGLAVTRQDENLLRRALGPSDDSAMNALWSRFDGSSAADRVAARLGLAGTLDPDDPSQWGEMRVSALDQLRLYEHVLAMPAPDRDLIVSALAAAPARARDGFAQDFGLLAPGPVTGAAASAVAKQGWMCCFGQRYYLNSAGFLGEDERFVVSLLSRQPRAGGWDAARDRLDQVADAVGGVLAGAAARAEGAHVAEGSGKG